MWIYLIMLAYLMGCAYVLWQMTWWLKRTAWGHRHKLHWLVITLSVINLVPMLGAFLPQSTFDSYLQKLGNIWMGWVAVFGICLIAAHIAKIKIHMVSTKQATVILGTAFVITAAFNFAGYMHAQHIYTHYYALKINAAGADLVEEQLIGKNYERLNDEIAYTAKTGEKVTRIAVLADMHMGVNTRYSTIEEIVDVVKASKADAVIGAGDYFTSSYIGLANADNYADLLAKMTEDDTPAYMAYGNHDVTEPLFCGFAIEDPANVYRHDDMDKFFERCNWQMLGDRAVKFDGLQFVFRKDQNKTGDGKNTRKTPGQLYNIVDKTVPTIVVEHEPEDYPALAKIGVALALSGHTHDGQIWPGTWVTRKMSSNAHGYKVKSGMATIVSSGTGYFGSPLRVGSHSEVVVIDLIHE